MKGNWTRTFDGVCIGALCVYATNSWWQALLIAIAWGAVSAAIEVWEIRR